MKDLDPIYNEPEDPNIIMLEWLDGLNTLDVMTQYYTAELMRRYNLTRERAVQVMLIWVQDVLENG